MLFPRILKMDQQVKSNSPGAVLMKGRAITLVRMVFDSVDYSCLVVNIVRFGVDYNNYNALAMAITSIVRTARTRSTKSMPTIIHLLCESDRC